MFRDLGDNGLISYPEYIFLLSVITKPELHLKIVFDMLDTDENKLVDKKEFLVLTKIFQRDNESKKKGTSMDQRNKPINKLLKMKSDLNTSLLIHFFGPKGIDFLSYDQFRKVKSYIFKNLKFINVSKIL